MQDLTITLLQTALAWEDISQNLSMLNNKINTIPIKTELIILPEMFSTGFSMNAAELAQDMEGAAVKWICSKSVDTGADITGSLIISEKGHYYNRLIWAKPDGRLFTYDKKHLFRFAGEDKVYSSGNRLLTIDLCGWKIRPFICYDLRFPVWTRNIDNPYDLAIFIANWPEKRAPHWKTLLEARAIENQCYVVGVNRVGKDGNGFSYSGDSTVIDPKGTILFRKSHEEAVKTITLSASALAEYRKAFPAWMDGDRMRLL